jgi:hypothetical protein
VDHGVGRGHTRVLTSGVLTSGVVGGGRRLNRRRIGGGPHHHRHGAWNWEFGGKGAASSSGDHTGSSCGSRRWGSESYGRVAATTVRGAGTEQADEVRPRYPRSGFVAIVSRPGEEK